MFFQNPCYMMAKMNGGICCGNINFYCAYRQSQLNTISMYGIPVPVAVHRCGNCGNSYSQQGIIAEQKTEEQKQLEAEQARKKAEEQKRLEAEQTRKKAEEERLQKEREEREKREREQRAREYEQKEAEKRERERQAQEYVSDHDLDRKDYYFGRVSLNDILDWD